MTKTPGGNPPTTSAPGRSAPAVGEYGQTLRLAEAANGWMARAYGRHYPRVEMDETEEIGEAEFAPAASAGTVIGRVGARINAELIRAFCVRRAGEVDARGIRLWGVRVVGRLDLTGVEVPFALRFESCSFERAPILHGARVRELAFIDCVELPGLLANGIVVQGDLELSGSRIAGCHSTSASMSRQAAVWLCESSIGGRLLCVDTVIEAPGERAVQADRMRVGGTMRLLNNFYANGELRLVGLQVSGSLDMAGAVIESDGPAVDLADATIAGNMFVAPSQDRRPEIRGVINLSGTRIDGMLLIRDATFVRPVQEQATSYSPRLDGQALVGLRLYVGAGFSFEGVTKVTGGIDLSSAELGRLAIEANIVIDAPGQTAINLTNAEVSSDIIALGAGLRVRGTILLVGARVRGRFDLAGATLSDGRGRSLLEVEGATVDGNVRLDRLRATGGELRFWRTTIGGDFDAAGAVVENPHGGTIRLHSSQVGGSVSLDNGFTSTGCVVLSSTVVRGRLDLNDGSFHCPMPSAYNPEGSAVRAVSAEFRGGMDLGWAAISPAVNVTGTSTSVLQDDPSMWPEEIYIAGFAYERFDAPRGAGARRRIWDWWQRLAWLRKQPEYDAGPYEQAARVFSQHGYAYGAEQLLRARRTDGRRAERRVKVPRFYHWPAFFGYAPRGPLWLLLALFALVSASLTVPAVQQTMRASDEGLVFTVDGPLNSADPAANLGPCGGGRVRCFNPTLYALDTVVPLMDLEQRATWYPERFAAGGRVVEWWLNLATAAGWLLSLAFLISLARLARTA